VSADYLKTKINQDKIQVQQASNESDMKAPVIPISKKDVGIQKEEQTTTSINKKLLNSKSIADTVIITESTNGIIE
jgi:hypothetical protein